MTASFTPGDNAWTRWEEWVTSPDPRDDRLAIGPGFDHLRLAPGKVLVMGGAPGAGKTALSGQWQMSAMEADPALRTLIANVEMPPRELLSRQAARLAWLALTGIRNRELVGEELERLGEAARRLRSVCNRLTFLDSPFTMANVIKAATATKSTLIVVDYAQRFGALDDSADARTSINSVMDTLRKMANQGAAVLVLSSLTRGRDSKGRATYDAESMSLASFKESGELEYGADDALLLCPRPDSALVDLRHEKSRYDAQRNLVLEFDRPHQSFSVVGGVDTAGAGRARPGPVSSPPGSSATPPDVLAQIRAARGEAT